MWAIALNGEQVAIGWLRKHFWSGFRFPLVGNSGRRECNQWWAKTTWLFGQFFQARFTSEHSAQIWPVLEIRASIHAKFAAKSTHWIYKNGTRRFASRAAFQSINDLLAQHSGQLLMFQGKSCSHGRAFTNLLFSFSFEEAHRLRKLEPCGRGGLKKRAKINVSFFERWDEYLILKVEFL